MLALIAMFIVCWHIYCCQSIYCWLFYPMVVKTPTYFICYWQTDSTYIRHTYNDPILMYNQFVICCLSMIWLLPLFRNYGTLVTFLNRHTSHDRDNTHVNRNCMSYTIYVFGIGIIGEGTQLKAPIICNGLNRQFWLLSCPNNRTI